MFVFSQSKSQNMLTIDAEFSAGPSIEEAIDMGIALAKRTECCVRAKMNTVTVYFYPKSDPEHLHENYQRSLSQGLEYCFG